jgi:fumarate hydratase subunit alpha
VVFMEIGQDVHLSGGTLKEAVDEGVRRGYQEGYFRGSIVGDPFQRKNTGDNTPCVLYTEIVPGDRVTVRFAPKGGGAENMSALRMLTPSAGVEGVKQFVIETVRNAGANPCPPIVIGVGIGGTFEKCAVLAKKALFRKVGERNPNEMVADLERELLKKVNELGIGPAGFGGKTTALDVFIEAHPCHIASLPVAVNMQCHAARHKEIII